MTKSNKLLILCFMCVPVSIAAGNAFTNNVIYAGFLSGAIQLYIGFIITIASGHD